MMKKHRVRAIELMPDLATTHEGKPFRWLEVMVEALKKRVPEDAQAVCLAHGLRDLEFTWESPMTEIEKMEAALAQMNALARQARDLIPRGGGMTAEETQKLRQLLGV